MYAVAIIDVPGYKNLMKYPDLRQRADGFIHWANRSIRYADGAPPGDGGKAMAAVYENNAIKIIYKIGEAGPFENVFWESLFYLCHCMMEGGYVVRGGVGFGNTSPEAYRAARKIEQRTVYPRIGIHDAPNVLDFLVPFEQRKLPKHAQFRGLLRKTDVYEFDFLRYNLNILDKVNEPIVIRLRLNMTRPLLQKGLGYVSPEDDGGETKKVREKYRWYAAYYNEVATEYGVGLIVIG